MLMQNLIMFGNFAKFKIRQMFTDEKGEVNIVAIVVLIGIAVLLALVFRKQIEQLLTNLFTTINQSATDAVTPGAASGGGGE